MTSPTSASGLPVPESLQRGAHGDRRIWLDSGEFAVDLLSRTVGRSDLAGVEVLDIGCGTKIVKTLLDHDLPVGRYVGIDVAAPIIEWLNEHVHDPRFEFRHFDAANERYNPGGRPLSSFDRMPVPDGAFDLICLFSVFTHLVPDDFVTMLELMRHHVKLNGLLLFSLHIEEPEAQSRTALALQARLDSPDPAVVEAAKAAIAQALATKERRFLDEVPEEPLLIARYETEYARELVDGTGWDIVSINPPVEPYIQHYMICRPV